MYHIPLLLAGLLSVVSPIQGYTLSRTYTGRDFITEFDFWDGNARKDPTGSPETPSAAFYTPQGPAEQQGLVWVNKAGHFGLSVDSKHVFSGSQLRPSVRIHSKESIHHGLLILDAVHLPYGTSTWPAFWLSGADGKWPYSGEMDIIEGIGNSVKNIVSYHTGPNVCHYNPNVEQTGSLNKAVGTDCNALEHGDTACGNIDPSTTSYGNGANSVGGGVWAVEWTPSHIKTWHFNRNNIPGDIANGKPNPDGWGTPVTNLDSSNCNIDAAYGPQSIIFNIELCGTWAGALFNGGPQACMDYVRKNPSAFKTAYFEINYLKYYQ
ncbi:glycoside hydrolase family 16 protein [Ramaria rubella]|nr:glycoside hydrolase family 16 protein [Ramaria rubella]